MLGWLCLTFFLLAQAQTFPIPQLPISKENSSFPDCRAEIIFVLDVSSSVNPADQRTIMRFVVQFMIAVEENVAEVKFGVVIFGIRGGTIASKGFDGRDLGAPVVNYMGPWGNNYSVVSSEVLLRLGNLSYGCHECRGVNASWSQLEFMYTVNYSGFLTPTWDGLNFATQEFAQHGDPTIPGRFIVLITDGLPNGDAGDCVPVNFNRTPCVEPILNTSKAVNMTKIGTLLITVGMNLNNGTQGLMVMWASEPKNILAVPTVDYSGLSLLIPKLLLVLCPSGKAAECLGEDVTSVDITGSGFLNTGNLKCRYFRVNEAPSPERTVQAIYRNSTMITCPLPDSDVFFPGEWVLEYTRDGRGYYPGSKFKYGTLCRPELLVIWWPFCALALLPLAFCRSKRVAPATTQKVTRGVARPAPAATEEYEEYEEVEEIVAPPEPVNKWKVAPTAYIGFGRARMSVDWAGVAPESAPHEGVRKKVVKKVVSDHAPVPTAGPAFVPSAASEPETETVTQSRPPQTVEEPDWVNSCMDRIAAIVCCCCVKRK